MYRSLEARMKDFIDYVPLVSTHLDVYSLKLVSIILETGPEILNSFDLNIFPKRIGYTDDFCEDRKKLLEKEKSRRKSNQSLTYTDYSGFLNKSMSLSTKTVEVMGLHEYIQPFKEDYPEWWNVYNKLKHDKYSNLKNATMKNTLKALCALTLLQYQLSDEAPDIGKFLKSSLFGNEYDIKYLRDKLTEI
jgi:hypothetical protein